LKIDYFNKGNYYYEDKFEEDENEKEEESEYEQELAFIHLNEFRNTIIKKLCDSINNNTLIIVERIEHGKHILDKLTKEITGKQIYFIEGKMEDEERDKIKKLMETENNIICIAISRIFSTGINIKNLHHIIFAMAGKAKVKIIQTIGRGVRMLDGKKKVTIFDLADNLRYGGSHLSKRIKLYNEEGLRYRFSTIKEKR